MKKIYVLALLSLTVGTTWSQTYAWAKIEGLWAYDYGLGIGTDNSGNVYVAGKYEENANFSGTILPCNNCNHDIYLAKYSPGGALIWIRTAGGNLGDYAHAMATDGSNFVYIAGEIEGANNLITFPGSPITLTSLADNDIMLAKYDLNGTLLWAKSAGGYSGEKALGVSYDAAGNAYICGLYEDTCYFPSATIYPHGPTGPSAANAARDFFIAKYDANGNFQWVRDGGGPGRDEALSIKCDAAGNCYVSGLYSNNAKIGSTTYTASSSYLDGFLVKYDSNGSLQWTKTVNGPYDEVGWSVTMDNAGKIYMGGEFNASVNFGPYTLYTNGNADLFLVCYNSSGTEQWAKNIGGPLSERPRGIGTDGTNILLTGQYGATVNFGPSTFTAADSSDVFFAKMDPSGNVIGVAVVGGSPDSTESLGYESGIGITADGAGNIYATGCVLQGGVFGSITPPNYTRTDMFITKIAQFAGVEETSVSSKNVSIYPNPGSGNMIVEIPTSATKTELTVYNSLGQVIFRKTYKMVSRVNLDVSNQEDGLYFVEIKNDNKTIATKKMVIQKQ